MSLPYFCPSYTSLKNKYLVWATGAGQLVSFFMSASGPFRYQVFSVLLTWNSSAYAGKHSHGSQNKRSWSRQTCRSQQILQGATPRSILRKGTYWLPSLRVHIVNSPSIAGRRASDRLASRSGLCVSHLMLQNTTGISEMTFKQYRWFSKYKRSYFYRTQIVNLEVMLLFWLCDLDYSDFSSCHDRRHWQQAGVGITNAKTITVSLLFAEIGS